MTFDNPITYNLLEDEVHACFILDVDAANPRNEYLHPCIARANVDGYNKLYVFVWHRDVAQKLAMQYNKEILGLTAGQAEAIQVSSMRFPKCRYPQHYEKNKELFEKVGKRLEETA